MIKIVHASDLHGSWYKLPEADMYIITGDMFENYPNIIHDDPPRLDDNGFLIGGWTREIDPVREKRLQWNWFQKKFLDKGKTLRSFLGSKDAPVIVVRGNHDFLDYGEMFGGEVYEITNDCFSINVLGLDICGFRGINYIAGEWADETQAYDFYSILRKVPRNIDVMVTHSPPYGILDGAEKYGVQAYTSWITERMYSDDKIPKLFCFGHVHHAAGTLEWDDGRTIFSNAATTHNVIEIDND